MEHFLKGMIIGILIAVPVGPVGALCVRRTLANGRLAGFFSGLGAASADAIYGFFAACGLTFISDFLVNEQYWLRIGGGVVLCAIGVRTFLANPHEKDEQLSPSGHAGVYASTFFITLTNPMTIFSFAAIFAGFGVGCVDGNWLTSVLLISGVFSGSAFWWLALVGAFSLFRGRIGLRTMAVVNRAAGAVIAFSGVLIFLSLVRSS